MKQKVASSFFMSDLVALDLRDSYRSATRVIPSLTAAAVMIGSKMTASNRLLAEYVELGERAHGLRDADALQRVGVAIQDLPLGAKTSSIGNYYTALALNRRGPEAYPAANRLLIEAAEGTLAAFRAKALIALGTNLNITGDRETALSAFGEARKLAPRSGSSGLHSCCVLEIQDAFFNYVDGDRRSALKVLRRLSPLVHSIAPHYPSLLHFYYNNLAVELVETGQMQEAQALRSVLVRSPFLAAYPEWQKTCADLALRFQPSSGSLVSIGEAFAPLPSNVLSMPARRSPDISTDILSECFSGSRRARVLDFKREKKRLRPRPRRGFIPRPTLLGPNALERMTFEQKQAFALRLLLSDEVTESELDQFITIAQSSTTLTD